MLVCCCTACLQEQPSGRCWWPHQSLSESWLPFRRTTQRVKVYAPTANCVQSLRTVTPIPGWALPHPYLPLPHAITARPHLEVRQLHQGSHEGSIRLLPLAAQAPQLLQPAQHGIPLAPWRLRHH